MAEARHPAAPSGNNAQTSLLGFFAGIENYTTHSIANIYNAYKAVLSFLLHIAIAKSFYRSTMQCHNLSV